MIGCYKICSLAAQRNRQPVVKKRGCGGPIYILFANISWPGAPHIIVITANSHLVVWPRTDQVHRRRHRLSRSIAYYIR